MPTLPRSTSVCNGRAWTWALFVLGSLFLLSLAPAPPVAAQEAAKEAAPAVKEEAPAPAPAVASAAAPASSGETAAPKNKSLLRWALEASGPIGVFLLCLSVYFTAVVIRLFMEMRVTEAVPPALVDKMEVAIREKKFQELYDACKDNDSFLARLVRTGVANLPNGRPEAKEAMNQVSDEIVIGMEAKISYLAIIGQLGPMIGLVGTIWGMIMSFQEIATAAGSQPKPEKVAEGISTALFITLEGVALAVPAIFFFSLFRNRIAVITMEATRVADRTIASLVQAAKQAKSG
ncbi:MotA/TolQ/ExbB proton channel family protein [Singulisphaera acidiphila]|uniref:Biopolymer transport protein n=1 Tax=Singulisphaera acidiphila (strain ATCC BAA-1392 / DSM 18658 / VKM B-2454 / MOB10) TaxID=886293 RepID=L0DKV7_SINAD|nr:MotA/TolQ/ExbB proton channel family protein [Singulisphaera acidiphila]AGA29301.1 biopolymer transport protein [Singulisphaera acidiphila DSM 18658]